MNMLIGVLCEVVSRVSMTQKDDIEIKMMRLRLRRLLQEADKDGDGWVSHKEFLAILSNDEAIKMLERVGVDVQALLDGAETFYTELSSTSKLSFDEFIQVILQFRCSVATTIRNLSSFRKMVRHHMIEVRNRLTVIEQNMIMIGAEAGVERSGSVANGSWVLASRAMMAAQAKPKDTEPAQGSEEPNGQIDEEEGSGEEGEVVNGESASSASSEQSTKSLLGLGVMRVSENGTCLAVDDEADGTLYQGRLGGGHELSL
eukprot:TRINITY_DN3977_c0_g2_i1.p1 TRINITY_DN3977_c0_g2~~TRINITY_DN3977_c0_g2_i1.p1  ORF type:complete len:259 (-),score=62.68 TRINITY_DN3977_c0_g2_i1:113-889(-)